MGGGTRGKGDVCIFNLPQLTFISKGPVSGDLLTDGPSDFPNDAATPSRRHVKVNDATAAQSSGWCAEADNIDLLSSFRRVFKATLPLAHAGPTAGEG